MRLLFRSSTFLVLLALLVVAAAVWIFATPGKPSRPVPLPVPSEDREIAWLNAATSTTNWQRFVQAVVAVTGVDPGPEAFPRMTTAIPEIAVPIDGQKGKLRIRWYKLTSEFDTAYWLDALARRDPPPLAIIGG